MTVRELREELEKIPLSFGRFVYFEHKGVRYPVTDVYEEKISSKDRSGTVMYVKAGGEGRPVNLGEIGNFLSGFVKADTPVMVGTEGNWSESVEIRMAEKYGIRGVDQFVLLSMGSSYAWRGFASCLPEQGKDFCRD